MKRLLLLFFLIVIGSFAQAQKKKTPTKSTVKIPPAVQQPVPMVSIRLQARYRGDSIVLRWGCNRAFAWRKLNEMGYVVERLELYANNKPSDSFLKLSTQPVKPWPESRFQQPGLKNDTYALVAAKALYGKTFVVSAGNTTTKSKDQQANTYVQNLNTAAEDQQQRFAISMMASSFSQAAANGLGVRFTDKAIRKNAKYIYRVYPVGTSALFKTDTALFIIETKKELALAPVQSLQFYEGDKIISLRWKDNEHYAGYYIERSSDGKNFSRLNQNPYIQFSSKENVNDNQFTYNDTLTANYKKQFYRIRGISLFSEISEPSDVVRAQGRDRTPPAAPFILKAEYLGKKSAVIDWSPYVIEPDLKGFFVSVGRDVKGPFELLQTAILPPSTLRFTDNKVIEGGLNYYMVTVVDTAGNISNSLPRYVVTPDNTPPTKPVGLAGKVDDKGVVQLHWHPGKESDIEGYRIYRANQKDHVFNPISATVPDTVFVDTVTLRTLTKYVYYQIVAVDRNKNNSAYSEILELKRPDKIPPVSPVINNFLSGEKSVQINWAISSSDDVVKQLLYRRKKNEEWKAIAELAPKTNMYKDTLVVRSNWYEYSLEAVDNAGLHSDKSFPLNVKVYDSGIRDAIKDISVKKNADGKSILLTWKYPIKGDYHFILYRAFNGEALQMYESTPGNINSFTDSSLKKGNYQYAVKAVYKDGGESGMSSSAKVIFNNP